MIEQVRSGKGNGASAGVALRRHPLAHWITTALALGAMQAAHAGGPPALSSAWLVQRQNMPVSSTPKPTGGVIPGLSGQTPAQLLQQRTVQQSITNLNSAAQLVAQQMAAQQQAAQSAQQQVSTPVPNGLVKGGLQVAAGATPGSSLWQNANAPIQSSAGGHTTVEIKQTGQKAIATWNSFNVGRQTTVYFNQSGGNQNSGGNNWIVLNRIQDASGVPSQIFGQIKAEGSVYLLNRNGVLFGAGSQVNTRSFLASSLDLFSSDVTASNSGFLNGGIASEASRNGVLTTDGVLADIPRYGNVTIERGASITAGAQGFALIAAPNVSNAGAIVADNGQAILAAGIQFSNLAGNNNGGALQIYNAAGAFDIFHQPAGGTVSNSGLIQSRRGQVQMLGYNVDQAGVALASTSISYPGSIRLIAEDMGRNVGGIGLDALTYDRSGALTLAPGSVTAVLPEKDGATTSSTPAADAAFVPSKLSLFGNSVTFQHGSLLEAPNAQLSVTTKLDTLGSQLDPRPNAGRIYIDDGAIVDVSGLADVELPLSALLVNIPRVGQNELANSPLLRNSFLYTQKNIQVDSTQNGTLANGLDWVGSPILNAAGYVQNLPRDISQMMTAGGGISLSGAEVIVRSGAQLNLDGGYLAYQPGFITTPNLLGANGRIYNIADADPNMTYVGFAGQYTVDHSRWGVSQTYGNSLLGGMTRWDSGFAVGGDAGSLNIKTANALVLDGDISAQAFAGRNQVANSTQPDGGALSIGSQAGALIDNKSFQPGLLLQQSSLVLDKLDPDFRFDTSWADALAGQDPAATPADDLRLWLPVSADMIARAGFQTISVDTRILTTENTVASTAPIVVQAGTRLEVGAGGSINLTGSRISVLGQLNAPAGSIALATTGFGTYQETAANNQIPPSDILVGAAAVLDVNGLWINDSGLSADALAGNRYINGGSIRLSTQVGHSSDGKDNSGSIRLLAGSLLDASGGGYVGPDAQLQLRHGVPDGHGGDISLLTYAVRPVGAGPESLGDNGNGSLQLDGTLRAYGFSGGGNLSLRASQIQIGGDPAEMVLANGLYLNPTFFAGQGFDNYALTAITDATVAAGTTVEVMRANLLPNYAALVSAPSGSDLYAVDAAHPQGLYAQVGQLAPYLRYVTRQTSAGHGPGFSLQAGDYTTWINGGGYPDYSGVSGVATLGAGSAILTDAGANVSLAGYSGTNVLGAIRAPGGAIDIGTVALVSLPLTQMPAAPQVWLGAGARLDASGAALFDPLAAAVSGPGGVASTPRTGLVLAGGNVNLTNVRGYVLGASGSSIDVSGAAAVFDLPVGAMGLFGPGVVYQATPVWSDAGSITVGAGAGLYLDSTLQAHGGAVQAQGGSLSISGLADVNWPDKASGILLQQSGQLLPAGQQPEQSVEAGAPSGLLHFALDRLDGSGITSLAIGPATDSTNLGNQVVVPLGFAGDIELNLGRSFTANASAYLALPAGSTSLATQAGSYAQGNGTVHIDAPYVNLSSASGNGVAPLARAGDGVLRIDADFIDLGGWLNLQQWVDASFVSTGDLRFYLPPAYAYSNGAARPGLLFSTGNLTFQAAQLYPASDYPFVIDANASGLKNALGQALATTVTILPNGASSAPLSAGGALLVDADHIEQRGTIRVPSGDLILGVQDPATTAAAFGLPSGGAFPLVATQSVHLAPGSITSVSLNGATVPFGSTVDGTDWRYSGDPLASAPDLAAPPAKQLSIGGIAVALDAGATIDLSGGGHLQASEWVSGIGGTRDVLAQNQTDYTNSTVGVSVPQYADGRAIYAIVPGYSSPVSAHDAALENGTGTGPAVGQSVYLSDVPGLPAGVYTLLPAKYATLPGAYRIVQNTSVGDSVLGNNAVLPDGTLSVTGYFTDALSGARTARNSSFLLQSGTVWQQYSKYTLTDADNYFAGQATQAGTVAPALPRDAGHLMLSAGEQLTLGATLTAAPGQGGRGSEVDIAARAIQIVAANDNARDGYLVLSADGLSTLGAGSLLLGGTRSLDAKGDVVATIADSVLVSNDSAHPLAGQEILLVANGDGSANAPGIVLESGSAILARGAASGAGSQQLSFGSNAGTDASGNPIAAVSGNGALLRVSQNGAAPVVRNHTSDASGQMTIQAGVTIDGGSALTLDTTGAMLVDPNATFSASAIDASSNLITFAGANADIDPPTAGLVIGTNTLNLFRNAQQVTLRSRGAMKFASDVDVDLPNVLELDAGAFTSDGGKVNIQAGTLSLGNALNASVPVFAAGGGRLLLTADELDFTAGNAILQGFASVQATANRGMTGQGAGGIDFGNLDVTLNTPVLLAQSGADTTLTTTGALHIAGHAGNPLNSDAMGGALNLRGGSVTVSTNVQAAAGNLSLTASQGDLTLTHGASLSTAGVNKTFFDTTTYAPGGALTLTASTGNLDVQAGASLAFGGAAQGGDAGRLILDAGGVVLINGRLDGHAGNSYRGGYFTLASGGSIDLDSVAQLSHTAGITGALSVTSGAGNLWLSAGNTLTMRNVYLAANGGSGMPGASGGNVRIDGSIDVSGSAAGSIELYGRSGVDVEGSLLAVSTLAQQRGGDVTIGTAGVTDGSLNTLYGYQNVQASGSGTVHLGAGAHIDVSGGAGDAGGTLSLRAPLLINGDVNIAIDGGNGSIVGARTVILEPYAKWSAADLAAHPSADPAKLFDGLIDPAGWYQYGTGGTPALVAGTWTNADGKVLAAPTDAQLQQYLSQNYFTPTAANAAHQGFYGYLNGDPAQGPGALMGYTQAPGFSFGNRYAGIANLQLRPGIELDNPSAGVNGGNISVLTNWNLGAGTTANDGSIGLAYRYQGLAPMLTVRAANDLDVQASITDGFYQQNDGAGLADPPAPVSDNGYAAALANYQTSQAYLDNNNGLWNNGSIKLKANVTVDISQDPYYQPLTAPLQGQTSDYYDNYQAYIGDFGAGTGWVAKYKGLLAKGFLAYSPTLLIAPQPGSGFANYADYVAAYQSWLKTNFNRTLSTTTPSPLLLPISGSDYTQYSTDYSSYIGGHVAYYTYVSSTVGSTVLGSQLFYAPFLPAANPANANPAYDQAVAAYKASQAYLDLNSGVWNGSIKLKANVTVDISQDPYYQPLTAPLQGQSADYYDNYQAYIGDFGAGTGWVAKYKGLLAKGFLAYSPTLLIAPQPGGGFANYAGYVAAYQSWLKTNFNRTLSTTTPSPLLLPISGSDYTQYSTDYSSYIGGHVAYYTYVSSTVGSTVLGSQLFYAPFLPAANPASNIGTTVPVPASAANNSPSNMPSLGSPVSLASATLLGGSSTSYRLVAGADFAAIDPLTVVAASADAGGVELDGHFAVKDTASTDANGNAINQVTNPRANKTLLFPTLIRTGMGDIDIASAGDIDWLDSAAPAAIYTAGAPAAGTTAGSGVAVVRPAENGAKAGVSGGNATVPDLLVNDLVNPDHGGDISLSAQGSIHGIEQVVDADGTLTKGAKGTYVGQFWWPWMQTGNAADGGRSSINFANFDQGLMSVGGNVSVSAGGDIRQLSVSLPTTWYANPDGRTITTVGGGDLVVQAGGDILSGSYFVANGSGRIQASGLIGSDFDYIVPSSVNSYGGISTPVATLLALQDAQIEVSARQGVDLGGVYNPSYSSWSSAPTNLIPAGHFDAQPYSADSALHVAATDGNVVLDSLSVPGVLFNYGGTALGGGNSINVNPGGILPATLSLAALNGNVEILGAGGLYPSASGNLSVLAAGSVALSQQVYTMGGYPAVAFGLIDASAALLPSPLQPTGQIADGSVVLANDALAMASQAYLDVLNGTQSFGNATLLHQADPLHGDDSQPVRVYALAGDITDGIFAPNGFQYRSLVLMPAKPALIYAGNDIVNLSLLGQQTHDADITRVAAGRDIYDTTLSTLSDTSYGPLPGDIERVPSLLLGGPGSFLVEAGRNIGPLSSQTEISTNNQLEGNLTGIDAIGNIVNPYLPHQSADISVLFGVGPGVDTAGFIASYLDKPGGATGFGSLTPDLIDFMQQRATGAVVDTGFAQDQISVSLSAEQARQQFDQLPEYEQRLFVEQALFKMLATVGTDYNNPGSAFFHQYARGYAALSSLFPAALGYTDNGGGQGGINGAQQTVGTGDLDIRSSTIQTQQGGNITILGPGGQALVGSAAAPPVITDAQGNVVAGPNSMGILTLEQGSVNIFTDRSLLLAQSRIFTEQGGDLTMWSSNGDINAGQGAKTVAEIPPPTYLCTVDAWCRIDARGQVSGAGIATLQTMPGAPMGNVSLIAPRGTVDAGDAGIRVSGNLIVAAAQVANADNIQVQGEQIGVPLAQSVNVSALTAASAAASAVSKVADDMSRQQRSDANGNMPSIISVQVLGFGGGDASASAGSRDDHPAYDPSSPVQVVGAGPLSDARKASLNEGEQRALSE